MRGRLCVSKSHEESGREAGGNEARRGETRRNEGQTRQENAGGAKRSKRGGRASEWQETNAR